MKQHQNLEAEVQKQLLELREKDKLLIAQSKLAAVGETLAHIAHQWKQPLAQINSVVASIEADHEEGKLDKQVLESHLNEIEKLTFYMSDTIESFNSYLQPNEGQEVFAVREALEDAIALVQGLLRSRQITLEMEIAEPFTVRGIKKEFIQALLVILNNAKDILVERDISDKQITIAVYRKAHQVQIDISDNAGGIEAEYMERIFDPYFTTKPHSQGTGHGLCMAKLIVQKRMHGELLADNAASGATFSISLDIAGAEDV
jgi:C4-dicarboxylate-specific signal transduction histidine kinase